ncbi:MAG: hypothetical protein JXR03_05335 [Cyclobacteriaceae bacterium]
MYSAKKSLFYAVLIALNIISLKSYSQSGPGGIGDNSGTSDLVLWLKADAGVLNGGAAAASDGEDVSVWQDQSGYGYNATTSSAPSFDAVNPNFNNLPSITFVEATDEKMIVEDDADEAPQLDGTSALSIFYVFNPDNSTGTRAHLSKRDGNGVGQSYVFYESTNIYSRTNSNNDVGGNLTGGVTYINALTYQNGNFEHFLNQSSGGTVSGTTSIPNNDSDLNIGDFHTGDGRTFDGNFAEIIIYRQYLTNAQRIAIETYLGSKYGITLAADYWDETTYATYDNEIAGIGQHSDGTVADSAISGVLTISGGTSRANGDWLFVGHDNGDFATYTSSEIISGSGHQRLAREWVVDKTNDLGDVAVSLKSSDIPSGISNPNVFLMVDSDGDASFEDATSYPMLLSGDSYTASVTLNEGDHLALSFEPGFPSEIWYSYISGNWNDPAVWTLDGAISALYNNPSSRIPTSSDSVVINSGRAVSMNVNDVTVTRLELIGTLDLGATTGHTFGSLTGSGTLRLSGAAGTENYPSGSSEGFYDSDEGGTLEVYGTGLTLTNKTRANNFILDLDNASDRVTMTADSLIVNGNATINQGFFQFNDDLATNNLVVEVMGNLVVESNGGVDVGTANARHELNLYRDFTNKGDVDFTNRTSQITGSEATDGIVDVNFLSPSQDQAVSLQNTTDFYRIEINKGVDDTYVVDISADNASHFNLYGYAALSTNSAQATTNANALGLIYGTIKVGDNITISPLNAGGNYSIYEGSQIWVDGGTVEKTSGTAIVPYGKIRVSAGALNAPINSGITTRDNGLLTIEAGTVTVNQFRTSINGVSAQGGLVMTGGVFNIIGGSTSGSYYTFSLTYSGNVFNMSGGTINLSGVNSKGGMYINSSDENINVTGGTVNFDVTNGNNLTITSNAPFFNANVLKSTGSGSGVIRVSSGSSGTGAGETTLTPSGLTIINDLRVDNTGGNGTSFDASGFDVDIIGALIVDNGATVDLTGMELTFKGAGSSALNIQTGATLTLDTLIVDKNLFETALTIDNGATNAVSINNLLNIKNGKFNPRSYDVTVNGAINILDTIGVSGSTGRIYMNGGSAQSITSISGMIYDLEIDNANGVSLDGDLGVDTLTLDAGVFDINTFKLTSNADIQTNSSFTNTLMIQTDGNASDGGLEYYFDGETADPSVIIYPIGTDANATVRYTPVLANLSAIAASDDGYLSINPVDSELGTTDISGGNILSYYWKVSHREFSSLPTTQYEFTYDASDDDATDEGNYVPGKVLDESPYTRSSEMQSNLNMNINAITFDADGGGGFTLENANYTAGVAGRFAGSVEIYYSRQDGDWHVNATWSTDSHEGASASDYPQAGDVAVIARSTSDATHTVVISEDASHPDDIAVAETVFGGGNKANLVIQTNGDLNSVDLGVVKGTEGTSATIIREIAPSTYTLAADLGQWSGISTNEFQFKSHNTGTILTLPTTFSVFPNLTIAGNSSGNKPGTPTYRVVLSHSVLVNSDLKLRSRLDLMLEDGDTETIEVLGNVSIGSNNDAILEFPETGSWTLNVAGDLGLLVGSSAGHGEQAELRIDENASIEHKIILGGDLVVDERGDGVDGANPVIDLYANVGGGGVILELAGTGSHSTIINNTGGGALLVPELYRILMNAGTDTTNSFTFNHTFSLNGSNTVVPQAIELNKGKLVFNNSLINEELTDGVNFTIPAGSGLEVSLGTITTANSVVILDGLLRVNGGTVDLGTTDIEYSTTGSALIEVTSGTLEVGGQIRRATSSTSGVLKYRQSGGDVDIATDGASTSSRAAFEVLNSGSEFTITGGTFNIQRGVAGDANESLELDPDTYNLTGSTITIFENLGSNYGSNYFNIKSAIEFDNLVVANSINLPDVRVYVQPLTTGSLTINPSQTVLANGLDVTIKGDFTNNGTYTNNSSTTILNNSSSQSISGSGTFTLFDLTKTGTGTSTSGVNLSLGNDLRVLNGTLDIGSNTIDLMNDAYIESTLTNVSGSGLVFSGTFGQNLYGKSNEIVSLGTITISNSNGVDIPDGNGFDFDITENLRLAGGVFNIGGSLVTMKEGSTITAVSPFNLNNMVQTNSSFTDNGFVVEFLGVDADTTIFYPVGELKYTAVSFAINAGATAGSIRVRPANERHPTIVDNDETALMPAETEIDDTQNSLQYYWVVQATGTTGVQGSATFFYDHDDILATQSDTSNFISGRILSNNSTWDKFLPTDFLGASQSFIVPLDQGSGVTFAEITGDYTAGLGSTNGMTNDIEGSLPDELAEYETSFSGSGNYSASANWNPLNGSPTVTDGVGPIGAQVIIRSGDELTLNISNVRLYSTQIEAGGVLRVPSGVTNVRLGNVTGNGTIVLTDTELLPTGEYSSFLACDGGTLQYSGTATYNVLSGISQIRKVIFDGSGTRNMPNNALSVCDSLIINGPAVSFNSGQTYSIGDADTDRLEIQSGSVSLINSSVLDVNGDFILSGGSFTGSTSTTVNISDDMTFSSGSLTLNGTTVIFDGSSSQNIDGDFTGASAFQDVTVNNSSGLGIVVNSGDVEIEGNLTFIDGFVNTTMTETLTLTSSGDWTGAGPQSFVTGPITKQSVDATSNFRFPIGKPTRYSPATIINVGTGGQNWTAEYFTDMDVYPSNSFDNSDPGSGFNPITNIQPNDRWRIESDGANTSQVRLTYGSHNSHSSEGDLRVALWSGGNSRWENQGGSVSGSMSAGTATSENTVHFSVNQFAIAEAKESTLPVTLTYFIGEIVDSKVRLSWQTATEIDNSHFEIERSLDGEYFEVIGEVKGNGSTTDIIDYEFFDRELLSGLIYYRFRQVDFDGEFEYSPTVFVHNKSRAALSIDVYPNPSPLNEMKVVWRSGDQISPIKFQIIGLDGRVHFNRIIESDDLTPVFSLDSDNELPQGIYLLFVTQGEDSKMMRIVVKD